MAITKLIQRYTFSDAHLNTVFQDYKRKTNELIDHFLGWDIGNLRLYDTDQSDLLDIKWNEDESNPYTLNLKVNSANRTIDLTGNLTVESSSIINSDLTTDANWATSGSITGTTSLLTTGKISTTGSIAGLATAGDIGLKNNAAIRFRNNADDAWKYALTYSTGDVTQIGNAGVAISIDSSQHVSLASNLGVGVSGWGTSAVKVLGIGGSTAPTTSPANMIQLWSADRAAGYAQLYYRAEGGVARPFNNIVNVKDFGAVGDDSNDDTVEIQAAADILTSGGILYFPEGTYLTSVDLTVKANSTWLAKNARIHNITSDQIIRNEDWTNGDDNITIDGIEIEANVPATGAISTVVAAPTAGGSGYSATDVLTVTTGSADATVTALTVDGSGVVLTLELTTAGTSGYSISAGNATSGGGGTGCTIEIDHVIRASTADFGMRFKNCNNLKIKNCKVVECGIGIECEVLTTYDIEISGNYVTKCVYHGIRARGNGLRVTNNKVYDHGYDDSDTENAKEALIVLYSGGAAGYNNVVANNSVYQFVHTGITVSKMHDVTVVGNVIDGNATANALGMEIYGCQRVNVIGNTIQNVTDHGILLMGNNPGFNSDSDERVNVTGNTIDTCEVGIYAIDYKCVNINNNIVSKWTDYGIAAIATDVNASDYYSKTGSGSICHNQILEMSGTDVAAIGIKVLGIGNFNVDSNVIQGMGAGTQCILVEGISDAWADRIENISIVENKIDNNVATDGITVNNIHQLTMHNQFTDNTFAGETVDTDNISGKFTHDTEYDSVPTGTKVGYYKGDVLRYTHASSDEGYWGWVVDVDGNYSALTTTGDITATETSLVVANSSEWYVGARIRVAGAGAAGADLDTTISSISGTTLTLTDAAGTTVDDGTVSFLDPTLRKLLQQPLQIFSSVDSRVILHADSQVTTGYLDFNVNDNAIVIPETNGYFRINEYNSNDELVRVTAAGLVGIGTATPGQKLEISGTGSTARIRLRDSDSDGAAAQAYIEFYDQDSRQGYIGMESGNIIIDPEDASSGILYIASAVTATGCLSDGTCEIMKNENALAIIDDILKTGSGKKDEYNHERMDMKKIHRKYPYMIHEQITEDEEGKGRKEYFDKLGAKSDLLYVAVGQLNKKIEALEQEIEKLKT